MTRFVRLSIFVGFATASYLALAKELLQIVTTTPEAMVWVTPPGATDGRQRAVIYGDPDKGSAFWTYRVRTTGPIRVEAHMHPVDEFITVLQGTWFLGVGDVFDIAGLKAYPQGSFVRIPAGARHYVATGEGVTIIQSSGSGQFRTEFFDLRKRIRQVPSPKR
jgi:mannose-6-phosphate isomerase-like protein (cupin superfamily)